MGENNLLQFRNIYKLYKCCNACVCVSRIQVKFVIVVMVKTIEELCRKRRAVKLVFHGTSRAYELPHSPSYSAVIIIVVIQDVLHDRSLGVTSTMVRGLSKSRAIFRNAVS